ncbi:MAG: hypothetical protein D6705_06830 [Deltaproteobacteria bacterium]|nr:MAG: hypothetical protein D6705_06830 [Deltaproteobacteria bacterium]
MRCGLAFAVASACALGPVSQAAARAGAVDPRQPSRSDAVAWPPTRATVTAPTRSTPKTSPSPPAPRVEERRRVRIAVGFSPEAPGTREERRIVDELEASARKVAGLSTSVRRLRAGAPEPARICREGREDLVVVVGYVPGRRHPVLLPYDCLLDRPLGIRGRAAARDPRLFETLWAEHERLVEQGVRPRRRWVNLGPKARGAIIGTAVVLVLGAAVAILVVGALRKEQVVLKVHP